MKSLRQIAVSLLIAILCVCRVQAAELSVVAPGLTDVGAYNTNSSFGAVTQPFVDICSGQSNALGQDNGGSKTVLPNILTTDSVTAPTQVYSAAFGKAPFNQTIGGATTTNPALAYNNACVWFANNQQLYNTLATGRPTLVLPNFQGAQQISAWIGNGTATIGGTVTTGDTVCLIWTSAQLAGSPISTCYTTVAGDTTTTIATGLAAAVMANTTLSAANGYGISTTNSGAVVTPTNVVTPVYPVNLGVTFTSSVSGAGTETVTLSFAAPPLWTALQANLAVVASAYPGFTVGHVQWIQAENDNSGTFGSLASYQLGFLVLEAQYRALSQWTPTTSISVQELGTWDRNSQQLRNDFIRTTNFGAFDKWTTMVSSAGMAESQENPIPHFDGNSLVALGGRHYAAWNAGRINGGYTYGTTYYGGNMAIPNPLTMPSMLSVLVAATAGNGTGGVNNSAIYTISGGTCSVQPALSVTWAAGVLTVNGVATPGLCTAPPSSPGTLAYASGSATGWTGATVTFTTNGQVNPDDIRSSAFIIANGAPVNLSNPARFLSLPLYIYAASGSALTSSGNTLQAANRGAVSSLSLAAGTLWRLTPNASLGIWRATQETTNGIGKGDFSRYIQGSALTGTSTIAGSTQVSGAAYTLNGATLTITPAFGMDGVFIGGTSNSTITVSSGTFILPDGTTPTTITEVPGETIWLVGAISGASSLSTYVIYDSALSAPSVQYSQPSTGTTVTVSCGFGDLTAIIDPTGSLATLTISLCASPRNSQKVTIKPTQNVAAVTYSGSTVATGAATAGLVASVPVILTYDSAQSKWY